MRKTVRKSIILNIGKSGCLAVLLLAAVPPSHAALMGDVDGDRQVTVGDAVRLLQGITGLRPSTAREKLLGDLWPEQETAQILHRRWTKGDGELTPADAVSVLKTAIGMQPLRDIGPVVYDVAGFGPFFTANAEKLHRENSPLVGDGPAEQILLFDPYDAAIGSGGEVYFTEYATGRIRVLETNGYVRTLAGGLTQGYVDGKGHRARFNRPMGIALLPDGSLVVADAFNHVIRRVTLNGEVTTLAGSGRPGWYDSWGTGASFNWPNGVGTDPDGNVYVADTSNHVIRKIATNGEVTTLAGEGEPGFQDGQGERARLYHPTGVFFDPRDGSLLIAEMSNHAIRKLTKEGYVSTLAGNGLPGHGDGHGRNAEFTAPYGVDLDPQGRIWIADWKGGMVRVLYPEQNNKVETAAGIPPDGGYIEGPALEARFKGLMYVRYAPNGMVYLTDTDNQRIRVLAP